MTVRYGLFPAKTTKLEDITEDGEYYVNTNECLESPKWHAGDYFCGGINGCEEHVHICLPSKRQFQIIFDGFDSDDYEAERIYELTSSILKMGQKQPGFVEKEPDGHFVLANGHHRFYTCHLLKVPYKIAIHSY